MAIVRRLIVPTIIGGFTTPLTIQIMFRGFSSMSDVEIDVGSFVFSSLFVFIGLLIFGLPFARWLTGTEWPFSARLGALIGAGALGGFVLASATFFGPVMGVFGILPGMAAALIWAACNLDFIRIRTGAYNG